MNASMKDFVMNSPITTAKPFDLRNSLV